MTNKLQQRQFLIFIKSNNYLDIGESLNEYLHELENRNINIDNQNFKNLEESQYNTNIHTFHDNTWNLFIISKTFDIAKEIVFDLIDKYKINEHDIIVSNYISRNPFFD